MFIKQVDKFKRHWPILLLLFAYFLVSVTRYKDFGIPSTYKNYYTRGFAYINNIFSLDMDISQFNFFSENEVNTAKDTIRNEIKTYDLVPAIQILLNLNNSLYTFNLLNLFMFSLVPILSYAILYKKYKSNVLALLGPIFVLLQPRLIGHAAVNPHNIAFTTMFFVSLTAILYFEKIKTTSISKFFTKTIVLGTLLGITQSISIFSYSLYLLIFFQIFYAVFTRYKESTIKNKFKYLTNSLIEIITIAIFSHALMFSTFLSLDLANYTSLFTNKFYIQQDKLTYFLGAFRQTDSRIYLGLQLLLATPIHILALLPLSLYFLRKKLLDGVYIAHIFLLFSSLIFFSVVQINTQKGIQDMLFLLPVIGMICSMVLIELFLEAEHFDLKGTFSLLIFVPLLFTALSIIRLHPYEYSYFNEVAGGFKTSAVYFEKDYLNLSYKEAVDKIPYEKDDRSVYLCEENDSTKYYLRDNLSITEDQNTADYIICDTLVHNIKPFIYIKRDGVVLNNVVRINY